METPQATESPFDFCTAPFSPSLSTEDMEKYLQSVMPDVDSAVKEALSSDSAPGGAVLSLVYADKLVWSNGHGLKDNKGNLGLLNKVEASGIAL